MVNKYYSIKYPTRSRLKDPWKNSSSNSSPKRRTLGRSPNKSLNILNIINLIIIIIIIHYEVSIERSFPPSIGKKIIQEILMNVGPQTPGDPDPPHPPLRRVIFLPGVIINTRFKILRVALSRFKTGSSRFEHGTRPARPSGIINSKPDIRTHILRSVFRRSIAALSRYIFLFSIL